MRKATEKQVSYRLKMAEYLPLKVVAERTGESVNQLARRLATQGKVETPACPGFRPDPAVIKRLDWIGQTIRETQQLIKNGLPYPPDAAAKLVELYDEVHAFIENAVRERVKE